MPNCGSCSRRFTGNHYYCDLCRCETSRCEGARSGGSSKCRTHLGLCLTPNCAGRIAAGQRYCAPCGVARTRPAPSASQVAANVERRSALFKAELEKSKGYRDHVKGILAVVAAIAATRKFNLYLEELTGWKNLKSWARWGMRALEPAMLKRMRYTAIIEVLTAEMLAAGMRRSYFAEKFLEEMILVCNAEIEKADISFVVSQAFAIFGPLLAPFSAAASHAVGGGIAGASTSGAISVGKALGQMGARAGGNALLIDPVDAAINERNVVSITGFGDAPTESTVYTPTGPGALGIGPVVGRGRSNAVFAPPSEIRTVVPTPRPTVAISEPLDASRDERYHYSVNPMQYAVALFKYLTLLASPTVSEMLVIDDFGGAARLARLYDLIKHPPID